MKWYKIEVRPKYSSKNYLNSTVKFCLMFIMKFGTNFGHFAWMKANKIETKTPLVPTKALFRTLHQFQH